MLDPEEEATVETPGSTPGRRSPLRLGGAEPRRLRWGSGSSRRAVAPSAHEAHGGTFVQFGRRRGGGDGGDSSSDAEDPPRGGDGGFGSRRSRPLFY